MMKMRNVLMICAIVALSSCEKKELCLGLNHKLDDLKESKEDLSSRIGNDPSTYSDIQSQNWDGSFNYTLKPMYQDSLDWYDNEINKVESDISNNDCN